VLYLLSTANSRVFRWSLAQKKHLNPFYVGPSPLFMAYASTSERLYLAYSSGTITRIDLAAGLGEEPFATLPQGPWGLAAVGEYVMAADPSGAWGTHYTFASDGKQISAVDWNYYSREYIWNEANRRLYFFRDDTSPNDLLYEVIDQQGRITGKGQTPYHGDYQIIHPIRVSQDGSRVLLGSGDIYDGLTLRIDGSLPIKPADAVWTADGLLTLRESPDGRTLLERWSGALALLDWQYFEGTPVRIVLWSGGCAVVTLIGGRPVVEAY
jgi:hypothetical protein